MPRSGQAQWRLKRKGAKATILPILPGKGKWEGPPERDRAPEKGLVPAPSPDLGLRILVPRAVSPATPQVQLLKAGKRRIRLHEKAPWGCGGG